MKLEACPACGGLPVMGGGLSLGSGEFRAVACGCGVNGPRRTTEEDAASGWNDMATGRFGDTSNRHYDPTVRYAQGILSGRFEASPVTRIVARAYLDLRVVEAALDSDRDVLSKALRRIAFEPQGPADASADHVLADCVQIAQEALERVAGTAWTVGRDRRNPPEPGERSPGEGGSRG